MAKELPYFKFEPSEWDNGNIQMCSREAKGLFMDLCCMYWSRLGDLPYALALRKHCNGDSSLIDELHDEGVITVFNEQIVIDFLDEQLYEFNELREKRRKAANKRWSDASDMQVHTKSNAIREEKKREENKKEDIIINGDFWDSFKKVTKNKTSDLVKKHGYDSRFEYLYNLSFSKEAKLPAFTYWLNLTLDEKRAVHLHWEKYTEIKNDKYQKLFRTYLSDRGWESNLESLKKTNGKESSKKGAEELNRLLKEQRTRSSSS